MIPTLLLIFLANAAADSVSGDFALKLVAGIFSGLGILFTAVWMAYKKGLAGSVSISGQPLQVKLEEHFVTRREFDKLESTINRDVAEMKGLFQQTMMALETQGKTTARRIETQNERLTESMQAIAKAAYDGRAKIWTKLNEKSEELAKLEAKTDVAREIGKLSEGLITAIKKHP